MSNGALQCVPRPFPGSADVAFPIVATIANGALRECRLAASMADILECHSGNPFINVLFTPADMGLRLTALELDLRLLERGT